MFERVGVVFPLGVECRYCGRQFLIRYVVVADNEVDAKAFGIRDFLDCLNPAIKYDYEFNACLFGIFYTFVAYSISFVVAVGYVLIDV